MFLMSSNRPEDATKTMAKLNPGCPALELNRRVGALAQYVQEQQAKTKRINLISGMKQKFVRKSLAIVLTLNGLSMLSGKNILQMYLTLFLPETNYVPKTAFPLICYSGAMFFSMVLSFIIEKFPRRFLYLAAAVFSMLLQLTNAFLCYFAWHQRTEFLKWTFITANFLSIIIPDVVIDMLNNGLRSEIFPPGVKEDANSICVVIRSAISIASIALFNVIEKYGDRYVHYVAFTIFWIILIVVASKTLPETRGMSLEEVGMSMAKYNKEKSNQEG